MVESAVAVMALLGLAGAHTGMQRQRPSENVCEEIEPTIRDRKYVKSSRLLKMRKDMIVGIEEVPNNSYLGTKRYHVQLVDGSTVEVHGPVAVGDFIEPV